MNYKEMKAIIKFMNDVSLFPGKGYKGEELIRRLDKLVKKTFKKIEDGKMKEDLKKMYEKNVKQYINDFGYDNLRLIKE